MVTQNTRPRTTILISPKSFDNKINWLYNAYYVVVKAT